MKKDMLSAICGAIGGVITSLFGGWSATMTTLIIVMISDYLTGLLLAGVFKKSNKTDSGALESKAGFKGLCKKAIILLFVLIGYRLDLALGSNYIKEAVTVGFIVNELLSIIENAGLMGVPLPSVITKAVEALKDNSSNDK